MRPPDRGARPSRWTQLTGELLWVHGEHEGARGAAAPRQLSGRGLAYWTDGKEERILYVTPGYRLIALDAKTGATGARPSARTARWISNWTTTRRFSPDLTTGEIGIQSAPVVAKDTVIVGAAFREGMTPKTMRNNKGYVRGFDVRTGKRLWIFHTIPSEGRVRLRHLGEGLRRVHRQHRRVDADLRGRATGAGLSAGGIAHRRLLRRPSSRQQPLWREPGVRRSEDRDARELKRRLLDSADARAAGLRVWLDKDDLAVGLGWQAQLEKAINEEATAFAVHIGAKGVVNWVESEVRLGLSRATGAVDYPFIPILAKECSGSTALPPFARQYQAVHDPLNDSEQFVKLLRAVLRRSSGDKTVVLDSPFVGLKAMTEADADRFFGRNEEIAELVAMLKQHRLIAIVADSGAGKSSLAQAGLVPTFRGGALSDAAGREPDDRLWHVVVMRPRRDPIEGLRRGVTEAAERLGRSADQCAALRKRIDAADPSETAYAIRCDLPVGRTETLLIVDQFEELLTETGEAQRAPFVNLLMALEAARRFRIVLTVRADHFNLCRPFSKLFEHLTRNGNEAVLRLRRITDQGIIEAVRNPLRLAGHTDVSEQDALIELDPARHHRSRRRSCPGANGALRHVAEAPDRWRQSSCRLFASRGRRGRTGSRSGAGPDPAPRRDRTPFTRPALHPAGAARRNRRSDAARRRPR